LIFSKKKDRKTAEARHAMIYYLVTSEGTSISHAARMLSLDHSTGQHAMKVVRGLLETNREFREKYERFLERAKDRYVTEGSAYEVVLCNTITNELLGFVSKEAAERHVDCNKNTSYCVYEKKEIV
jgi:hypothetical protein